MLHEKTVSILKTKQYKMFSSFVLVIYLVQNTGMAEYVPSQKHFCKMEGNVTMRCNFIPESIPTGIVNIHLNLEVTSDTKLDNNTFIYGGYRGILQLELLADSANGNILFLEDNCFKGLNRLQVLRLHVISRLTLFPKTFFGLDDVETLDMSKSFRLNMSEFIQAMSGSGKLPRLSTLLLSNCSLYRNPFVVDDKFVQVLQTKKISYLDISGLQLAKVNITSICKRLNDLKVVNASYISIGEMEHKELVQDDIKQIKSVDFSSIALSKKSLPFPPGNLVLSNYSSKISDFDNYDAFKLILTPETINGSRIVPHVTSLWIKNCTVTVDRLPNMFTKELIFRQNNIRQLDVTLICETFSFSSFEIVDISHNGLEFVHPDFSSCIPNLQIIDASNNLLNKMANENTYAFEHMFSGLRYLKKINLSRNKLLKIPTKMFVNNGEIEVIDLSNNRLNQVHFDLTRLNNLKILNLLRNKIQTLDTVSINNLNSVPIENVKNFTVVLKFNPLSCSTCQAKPFLTWLMSTKFVNVSLQELTCVNENSSIEGINETTLDMVRKICERKTIIIITSVSVGVSILILLVTFFICVLQRKYTRKLQNRENVINLLRKGEGTYEFVVFLAFSNEDEEFVDRYIINSLNENLQLMTGIDRELVCTGDRHFRPGFYVHNEAYRRLDSASVMIVVASDNFCRSDYCQNELDQAYVKKKPIVLMFTEYIDEDTMTPTMKELYQRNVRILWTLENDEYKMKTTWENVCTSILDLIH